MNKQELQYALESDFINACLVTCIALLLIPRSTADRFCVYTGRCGHPSILLSTLRHHLCAEMTFLLKMRKTRTYQPSPEV